MMTTKTKKMVLGIAALMTAAQGWAASDAPTDTKMSPYIFNGERVAISNRPYQVALIDSNNRFVCGGAVVRGRWVLTAAHCVTGGAQITRVIAGVDDLSRTITADKAFTVDKTIVHSGYNKSNPFAANDIALLRVNRSFPGSVQRLRLADDVIMALAGAPDDTATISGFGVTEDSGGAASMVLSAAGIEILDDSDCSTYLTQQGVPATDLSRKICGAPVAADQGGACPGDSGGPLTVKVNGTEYSAGVVDTGSLSCTSAVTTFARTASFEYWAHMTMNYNTPSVGCSWLYSYSSSHTGGGGVWGPEAYGNKCSVNNLGQTFRRTSGSGTYTFTCTEEEFSSAAVRKSHNFAACE